MSNSIQHQERRRVRAKQHAKGKAMLRKRGGELATLRPAMNRASLTVAELLMMQALRKRTPEADREESTEGGKN